MQLSGQDQYGARQDKKSAEAGADPMPANPDSGQEIPSKQTDQKENLSQNEQPDWPYILQEICFLPAAACSRRKICRSDSCGSEDTQQKQVQDCRPDDKL